MGEFMGEFDEYVMFENVGGRVYCSLSGPYPQELCLSVKARQLRRLARFFLSLGRGRRRGRFCAHVKSEDISFVFRIRAKRRGKCEKPALSFRYSFWNDRFGVVSESETNYFCFGRGALRRFGGELLRFEKTGKALLAED